MVEGRDSGTEGGSRADAGVVDGARQTEGGGAGGGRQAVRVVTPPPSAGTCPALAAARLVDRIRHGRHVRYRRSPLGAALCHGQTDTPAAGS